MKNIKTIMEELKPSNWLFAVIKKRYLKASIINTLLFLSIIYFYNNVFINSPVNSNMSLEISFLVYYVIILTISMILNIILLYVQLFIKHISKGVKHV